MAKELKISERIGTQGWEQFLANKQEMLYQFELAKKYADSHIVKVSHGNVAEAVFRKWLKGFLPEKFGVTSGYIVSQSNQSIDLKLPHYDVIIYDKLNSPTLWVEESPDTSEDGHTRAIPAEYVGAVIEVKSNLTNKTSKDSLSKINELRPLLRGFNQTTDYDGLLNPRFFGMSVFFEVQKINEYKADILDNLVSPMDMPYYGGVILSGEGRNVNDTGHFRMLIGDTKIESTIGEDKGSLITGSPLANSVETADKQFAGTMLTWSPANFSFFAFDIIALLEGRYQAGKISSKYGMSWMNSNRKK